MSWLDTRDVNKASGRVRSLLGQQPGDGVGDLLRLPSPFERNKILGLCSPTWVAPQGMNLSVDEAGTHAIDTSPAQWRRLLLIGVNREQI